MSGQWPPEWDDPEDNIPEEADQHDTEAEAGLSEVAAYLASVPAPPMPGSVEARISAALAVEATARAGIPALGPAPARAQVRRREVRGQRGGRDAREVLGKFVLGPLAVCLLIVVIALGLSHAGSSSSSSSAVSAAGAPAPAVSSAASSAAAASGGYGVSSAAASAAVPGPASTGAGFVVTESGTRYQQATLAKQAQLQVFANKSLEMGPGVPSASSASASSSGAVASTSSGARHAYAPNAKLRACVLKVTGGVVPELVDRATYQGTPVYVIASSSRVWVVGLGCTAASPQLITSVPLAS